MSEELKVSTPRIQALIPIQSSSSSRHTNLHTTEPPEHLHHISAPAENHRIERLPSISHLNTLKNDNINDTSKPKSHQSIPINNVDRQVCLRHDVLIWQTAAGGPVLLEDISFCDEIPVDYDSEPWLFSENTALDDGICAEFSNYSADALEVSIDKGVLGYGLGVTGARGELYVCCVRHGSPGWQAGIRFGHRIVEINGQSTHHWSPQTAKLLISSSDHLTLRAKLPAGQKTTRIERRFRHHGLGIFMDGNLITGVEEGTLAHSAGMEAGWCIVAVGDMCTVGADKNDMKHAMGQAGISLTFTLLPKSLHDDIAAFMGPQKIKFLTGQLEN